MIQRLLLSSLFLSLMALATPVWAETTCELCTGPVAVSAGDAVSGYPLLRVDLTGPPDSREVPANRPGAQASLLVEVRLEDFGTVVESLGPVLDLARRLAPLEAVGIRVHGSSPEVTAFAIKHVAATVQGERLAQASLTPAGSVEELDRLHAHGVLPYIDRLVVPASEIESVTAWLAENAPATRIGAVVSSERENAWYRAAGLLSRGADRAWIEGDELPSFTELNTALSGDFSVDPSTSIRMMDAAGNSLDARTLTFVRGSDLATVGVPEAVAGPASIVVIDDSTAVRPRLYAPGITGVDATDTGRRGSTLLVGLTGRPPVAVAWERDLELGETVARESVDVAGSRTPSVEEIVRQHQAWGRQQVANPASWIARNLTTLRFSITAGERFEASFAGDQFHRADGLTDWAWEDLYINGVRWKRREIPEIPLVQPEKVTRLPLEILFTDDYRYELAGARTIGDTPTWEVRFSPVPAAVSDVPLYRGTVWIDQKTWAPIRTTRVQLGMEGGETLSNEETIDYTAFRRSDSSAVTPSGAAAIDRDELLWLPVRVVSQQVLSVIGRTLPVERRSELSEIRIDPADFERQLETKLASDLRMVRDTDAGMRYLVKDEDGERYVQETTESGQYFLIGGLHHDESFEYPVVPLGGVNYFDFDLLDRGLQANVFFAGVIVSASVADPSFLGTRTSVGIDSFALAIPFENTMTRDGEEVPGEAVMNRPLVLAARAGHPFLEFGKIDFAVGFNWQHFERADDTAADFIIPTDTLLIAPGLDVRYERAGWLLSAFGEYGHRSRWEPWGLPQEYSDEQRDYQRWGATIGKNFFLPAFQRLGIEVNWLDGSDLDRFSKYELGFFGAQRVRGIRSGSVRAEEALIAHLSYGFVFTDQFRLEAFYDHALLTDRISGWDREPLQGVGISGQIIGPWGTLLRLDLGKSVGDNAQDGFVADVMLLKIFDPPWQRKRR